MNYYTRRLFRSRRSSLSTGLTVAKLLYKKRLTADCLIGIDELGHTEADAGAPRLHDLPAPIPAVRFGASEVVITTRCPDFGKVDLEVWAGDPGPQ